MEISNYTEIASKLSRIKRGSVVYLVSDIMQLAFACKKNGEKFDADLFLTSVQEAIGTEGTLLVPTFNWDFCRGVEFDANTTKSQVGVLGNVALKRPDFVRTHHPIYSFAVWGKDAQMLYNAKTVSSFGNDSLFSYMHENDAVALVVGLSPTAGTTFVHYVEQCMHVPFRYVKSFTGFCTDKNGLREEKTVTMFVRHLDVSPEYKTGLDDVLTTLNVSKTNYYGSVPFHTIYLKQMFPIVAADICCNEARNLYDYDRHTFKLDYSQCRRFFP